MHNNFRWFAQDKKVLNSSLKVMLVISGFYMFAFGMFVPVYALFVESVGGGVQTASNAWAVFYLTAGILTFFTGNWENKLRETEVGLIVSQFMVAAAYVVFYFTHNVAMLYAAQILLGVAAALFWPAFHSLYGKHVKKSKAAAQWSFYDGLAYLIPAIAAVLSGFIINTAGFQAIFVIMFGLSILNGVFVWILPWDMI